ncbi:MAG: adenosine kinase [Bacteroidales bacterium]
MKKILGIGNALVDIVTFIDDEKILEKFALPKGSMQLVDRVTSEIIREETGHLQSIFSSGGSAANTIHGLAMMGAETGFIGSVGKDEAGNFFESELNYAGVNTYLKRTDNPTGTAVTLVSPDSERTFATYLGAAVELDIKELRENLFGNYDILYLEGYLIYNRDFVLRACSLAKALNMKVALDLASYNVVTEKLGSFKDVIENYIDIIFANSEEAIAYTGKEPYKALLILSEQCEIAVVKTGVKGSLVKRGNEVIKIKAFPVECRDTTGAGDLYAAGFLYGYACNKSLEKCGLYGSFLAARIIETTGARIENYKWPEIKKTISEL